MALTLIPEIGARYWYMNVGEFSVKSIIENVNVLEDRMFVPSTLVINGVPTPVLFLDEGLLSESRIQRFILVDESKTIIELLRDCLVVVAWLA